MSDHEILLVGGTNSAKTMIADFQCYVINVTENYLDKVMLRNDEFDNHPVINMSAQEMPMLLGPAQTIITGD